MMRRLATGLANRARRARLEAARRRTARTRPPTTDLTVEPQGAEWWSAMVRPDATVTHRPNPDLVLEPPADGCLQPRLDHPGSAPVPWVRPQRFETLARAGRRTVDVAAPHGADDPAVMAWLAATADAHEAYRAAHRLSVHDLLEARAGRTLPRREAITVVCVTNRPHLLDEALANYERQHHPDKRLILVTNAASFDQRVVAARLESVPNARLLAVNEDRSLGHCLNMGLDLAGTRFVAKFDDDDHYGAHYLGDMLLAHRFADAGVVGKHSYTAYVEALDHTYVRFPGREFEYTSFVAGGTLVIDRERIPDVRFPDVSLGEDGRFLRACERAGAGIYAADRFNYLQVRSAGNTWSLEADAFLSKAAEVGSGRRLDVAVR